MKEQEFMMLSAQQVNLVLQLREKKLKAGLPFMINTPDLPANLCYLEYPDHKIELISLSQSGNDYYVVSVLSKEDAQALRQKYKLRDV